MALGRTDTREWGDGTLAAAIRIAAVLHVRITNIRRDALHKLTSAITSGFTSIGIEA